MVGERKTTMRSGELRIVFGYRFQNFDVWLSLMGFETNGLRWWYGMGFDLLVRFGAGPWAAAHFHLEQWAQRKEKQRMYEREMAIPEMVEMMAARKKATMVLYGEGLSTGFLEAEWTSVPEAMCMVANG